MSELEKIFLTSGATILTGIIIFVVGQLINEFILKPYLQYKGVVGKIDEELIFASNIYMNPGAHNSGSDYAIKVSENLRRLASEWGASYRQISKRSFFQRLHLIVTKKEKDTIERDLVGLANSLWANDALDHNMKRSASIRGLLRI